MKIQYFVQYISKIADYCVNHKKCLSNNLQLTILVTSIQYVEAWTNYLYRHQSKKMSSSKKLICKRLCGRCLSGFIDWKYSQSCWYFRPSFVNFCPSNLFSGSNPPPIPYVNMFTVYTYTVCKGGGVSWPQTDKHLP